MPHIFLYKFNLINLKHIIYIIILIKKKYCWYPYYPNVKIKPMFFTGQFKFQLLKLNYNSNY